MVVFLGLLTHRLEFFREKPAAAPGPQTVQISRSPESWMNVYQNGKKIIAFVPDRPFLYEKLTGMEFLKFIADLYRVDLRVFSRRAPELLEQLALRQWKDEIVEAYSHSRMHGHSFSLPQILWFVLSFWPRAVSMRVCSLLSHDAGREKSVEKLIAGPFSHRAKEAREIVRS